MSHIAQVEFGFKQGLVHFYGLSTNEVKELFKAPYKLLNHTFIRELKNVNKSWLFDVCYLTATHVHETEDYSDLVRAIKTVMSEVPSLGQTFKRFKVKDIVSS